MCNYCQTSTIFGNTNCSNTSWRVQRVWCDGCGNVHVVLTSGGQGCRQNCGTYHCGQCVGVTNDTSIADNGCSRVCGGVVTQGNTTTPNLMTTQDCELYYARQYGLYPYNRATSGCGCGFIGSTAQ